MKKYIDWHGRRLHVQTFGRPQRKTLVLLHGYCEDLSIWHHLLSRLTGMRVILLDLPGFGKSGPLQQAGSLEAYADAVAFALRQVKVSQAVVLGHSLGGYVALQFARSYPDLVSGFGLVNSHPLADAPERKEARNKTIQLIASGGKKNFVRQLIPGLFHPDFADKQQVQALIRLAAKGPDEGIVHAAEAMRDRPDQTDFLSKAQVPVLMLLGDDDHLVTRPMRDQFIHLPAVAQVVLLPKVAHMAMFEAPQQTCEALNEFVSFCYQHSQ